MTMTGFSGQSDAMRRFNEPVRATSRTDRQAAQLHAQAAQALQQGQLDAARDAMEQAVASTRATPATASCSPTSI